MLCDWVHGVSGGELFPPPFPFSTRRIVFLPLFSSPDGMCGLQGFNCGSIEYYNYIIDGIVIEVDKEHRSTVYPIFFFVFRELCACVWHSAGFLSYYVESASDHIWCLGPAVRRRFYAVAWSLGGSL